MNDALTTLRSDELIIGMTVSFAPVDLEDPDWRDNTYWSDIVGFTILPSGRIRLRLRNAFGAIRTEDVWPATTYDVYDDEA